MNIHHQDETTKVIHGDCIETMNQMEPESVDAIVCDPPYGLSNTTPAQVADTITKWAGGDRGHVPTGRGFMGKSWDAFVPPPAVWDECMRVLKPGGHMVVFAGSRTQDLMGLSIRLAGFEMRDSLAWLYGSGFPKSMNVSKAIDKAAGVEGAYGAPKSAAHAAHIGKGDYSTDEKNAGWERPWMHDADAIDRSARIYEGGSEDSRRWTGWGTALKPAFEPIVLARKPLAEKTVARNVLTHGTGAINVDACRVTPLTGAEVARSGKSTNGGIYGDYGSVDWKRDGAAPSGRWPANVLLDQHTAAWVDEQSGHQKDGVAVNRNRDPEADKQAAIYGTYKNGNRPDITYGGGGGASRFFYSAKAPKSERPNVDGVQHPTVKPLAIMEWLLRLVTPPGGTVLDPFAGSGTTLEAARSTGHKSIGIEAEETYLPLIDQRLQRSNTIPTED